MQHFRETGHRAIGTCFWRDLGKVPLFCLDKRYFTTIVILGKHEPAWPECTNEEKEEWEREHPAPEPPEDQKTEE